MRNKVIRITIIILSSILALLIAAGVFVHFQMTPSRQPPTPELPGETPEPSPEIIDVRGVRITVENDEMLVGTRFWPEVIIYPEGATDKTFQLHSDNELVVRLQGNNWVATEVGTANLIATTSNGITGMVMVRVIAPALESMSFQEEEVSMTPGDIFMLTPIIVPRDAGLDEPIHYTSSNDNVASVSNDGRITAIGPGNATIRGTVGDIRAEIRVTVEVPFRNISIIMNRHVFSVGERAEFTIQVEPANATNATGTVSFSGAPVSSVGTNAFTCDAAGEVVITFTADNGREASQTITVFNLAVLADEVFRLTNIERTNAGLTHLGRTTALNQVALLRAREIISSFSHTRPDGREFFTAFTDNGVEYRFAGENLAAGQTSPAEAVQSWMNSQGHRENLLNSEFGNIGVGVALDSDGRLYWTQMFMN